MPERSLRFLGPLRLTAVEPRHKDHPLTSAGAQLLADVERILATESPDN